MASNYLAKAEFSIPKLHLHVTQSSLLDLNLADFANSIRQLFGLTIKYVEILKMMPYLVYNYQ